MADNQKSIPALFYQSESGKQPVRDWLMKLEVADRKTVGTDIKTVEFGWPIGMPTCRPMGKGLYEVRSSLTGNRIARVLFIYLQQPNDSATRIHQEVTEDTEAGVRYRPR